MTSARRSNSTIRKRWIRYALVNAIILVAVIGAMIVCYAALNVSMTQQRSKNQLKAFGQAAERYSLEDLLASTSQSVNAVLSNPNFSIVVFQRRANGTLQIFSKDDFFVANNAPLMTPDAGEVRNETLGGSRFLTYTSSSLTYASGSVTNALGQTAYLKVYLAQDLYRADVLGQSQLATGFFFLFVFAAIGISIFMGYLQVKPVVDDYENQKNLINDMSHEIRTPLTVIKGNLENMAIRPDSTVGEMDGLIDQSLAEVERMYSISQGLLQIIKGQFVDQTKIKSTDLNDVVTEVIGMFADTDALGRRSVFVNVEKCSVDLERDKIKQLLIILIDNAVKYSPDDGRIRVTLKNNRTDIVLTVSDNGIGVEESELGKIFDRLYRAENAKDISGTGIGLAVAKSIVEGYHGSISASKNYPKGLAILVKIPKIG